MEAERPLILAEAHEGITGGHYAGKETVQKVLRAGLWWPTLHRDDKDYSKSLRCMPKGWETIQKR
jgi:hypothetical protein